MEKMNFDFINLIKAFKAYLININKDFKAKSIPHRFYKHYCFRGGLSKKYQPFLMWFKKDITQWLESWE